MEECMPVEANLQLNLGKERTHERQIKRNRYAGGYA